MVRTIAGIEVTVTRTETEALLLEYNLIKAHRAALQHRAARRQELSVHPADARITVPAAGVLPRPAHEQGAAFGPFPNAGAVRETLSQLQKLFQLRNCEDSFFANRSRPCLQHQIQRCTAPCVGLITQEDYAHDLEHAVLFLARPQRRGDRASCSERMEQAAASLEFERAAQYPRPAREAQERAVAAAHGERARRLRRGRPRRGPRHSVRQRSCSSAAAARSAAATISRRSRRADRTRTRSSARSCCSTTAAATRRTEILVSRAVPEAAALAELLTSAVRAQGRDQVARARRPRALRRDGRDERAPRRGAPLSGERVVRGPARGARARRSICPRRRAGSSASTSATRAARRRSRRASCSAPEGPLKSEYRRFNIDGIDARRRLRRDARRCSTRRYARVKQGEVPMPDVLFIDGGPGQIAAGAARARGARRSPTCAWSASRRARSQAGPREPVSAGARGAAASCRPARLHYT